ncbi:MAG: mechanosensitive ion channel domain-containing protein [Chloroflexota bacterium]
MDFINQILTQIPILLTTFGSSTLAATVIFIIGYQIAKLLRRVAQRTVDNSNIDSTLGRFVINLAYYTVLVFVMMAALDQLGVDTNSLVAIVGAAGLAAGLAMEGALANFVAGIMLILLRPFKEGDYVEIADLHGAVEQIAIVQTRIITFENETVILPNRDITDGKIINYSMRGYVELELPFYVDFEADLDQALEILQEVADNSLYTVDEPRSGAFVLEMGESSIKLLIEANILPQHREKATYDLTKNVLLAFQNNGIKMPLQRWRQGL